MRRHTRINTHDIRWLFVEGMGRRSFMPEDLLDLVPLLARDEALHKKILVDNPARLYGFDSAE